MPTIGALRCWPPVEPRKDWQNEKTPPSDATRRYPGSEEQFVAPPSWRACPEFGSIMSDDSSTASNALAGTVLSSSTRDRGQLSSAVPPKYQLEPLSARISPYCCMARSTTWAWAEYPEMSKLALSRKRAPMGGRSGFDD